MNRVERVKEIERRLGKRKLVWFGTRGVDAEPLTALRQFSESFCLTAPLDSMLADAGTCLESLKKRRVDTDCYSLEGDPSMEARHLERHLGASLDETSAVVVYWPSGFFSSIYFPRRGTIEYLGLLREQQAAFEHKPWVETELRKVGVKVTPWEYWRCGDQKRLAEALRHAPLVLRRNRSEGGEGFVLVREPNDIPEGWPPAQDGFFGAAPLLEPNVPVNVNACVFPDGSTSLHAPSVQLIGIRSCTRKTFGHCGNDFARVRDLGPEVLNDLEAMTRSVGTWLSGMGYVGAFGVDAIWRQGELYLCEVNPRFQGSSAIAARAARDLGRSDIFLDHISAFLNLPAPPSISLWELARHQPRISQVLPRNTSPYPTRRCAEGLSKQPLNQMAMLPADDVEVDLGGVLFKMIVEESVTEDGHSLAEPYGELAQRCASQLFSPVGPEG